MSLCSKPGCAGAGAVVLGYDYAARVASLQDPPDGQLSPHLYTLCISCAERLRLPMGWSLDDRRVLPPLFLDVDRDGVIDLARERPVSDDAARDAPGEARRLFFGSSA